MGLSVDGGVFLRAENQGARPPGFDMLLNAKTLLQSILQDL